MAQEAYVKITEILKDAPALASTSTPFLVAGVIKSRYGDFEVSYFNSRRKFLEKYTCDGKLNGKCDVSLINAYEILGSSPILVSRAAASEYEPKKIDITSGINRLFSVQFNDFMKDSQYQVKYDIHKSATNPGTIILDVKYEKVSSMYKYTFDSVTSGSGGSDYEVGEVVTLKNTDGTVSIKARILTVDENGSVLTLRLLTQVGDAPVTEFTQVSGGSGIGLQITVTSDAMPNEVVKSYYVIFSLDETVVDENGNSLYYRNVWKDEYPFKIDLGEGQPEEVTVSNPYVENDPTQPETLTFMDYGPESPLTGILATTIDTTITEDVYDEVSDPSGIHWGKFENYEDRKIPMFVDFGTADLTTYLKPLANQFDGMYAISVPRNRESYASISTWDGLDLGNSRFHGSTPFAMTTHLGFLAPIAPSTQYVQSICRNAVAGREFETVAGEDTGIVGYSNLTKRYDKKEREKLLGLKINTIVFKEVDGYAMFNDNLTGLVMNNPFKEEFNRRLGVRIAQDIDTLMQPFKFKLNTASSRDTIQSVLANYFDTAPFKDKIWAYEVICNDENNPAWLQAQNKLAVTVNVAFYYTSKFIEVLNNIYSVGQAFTA